jgi:hypothetical protein
VLRRSRGLAQATRSLGDLRPRLVAGQEVRRFWDLERPRFALQEGPGWLALDPHTGVLCGTPDVAGRVEVALSATITRERRTLDEEALGWGHERVTAIDREEVGVAVQRFTVDVT